MPTTLRFPKGWLAGLGLLGASALCLWPTPVDAGAHSRVSLIQTPSPGKLTEKGLLGWAKKNQVSRLQELKGGPIESRMWMGEMIVEFGSPPGDLEYHVLFFDIEGGQRRFVEDMSVYVSDRSQRVFVQRFKLPRPRFIPNRKMELVVTVRRQEVGTLRFETTGEVPKRDNRVNFSDEDTK
jgi:hypothetical protein